MKSRKWYEWLLTVVFILTVVLCIFLNLFSGQKEGISNLIVNALMFVMVAVILLNCERNSFLPMNDIITDLEHATQRIRSDAMNSHQFLWEQYQANRIELFTNKRLKEEYQDYLYELKRISNMDKAYYKCDIEDYINDDLVDSVMHRNLLNQVAGAMTGLGILGTFVGLSIGLESFSTGTTAEITNSISPLMDGIKVAFHTSIYGMIFSLTFNYAYKRKLDDAEWAVRNFLTAYKKYVLPDTTTDGINRLMELQYQQVSAIHSLTKETTERLNEIMKPQFDRLDKTITSFANMATQNQMDALGVVVQAFVREMDKSLDGSVRKLSDTITETYQLQQHNAAVMQEILSGAGVNAGNLREINRQNTEIITALDESVASFRSELKDQEIAIRHIRNEVQQMPGGIDHTFQVINDNLTDVETHFRDTILEIKSATDMIPETVRSSYAGIGESLERMEEAVDRLSDAIDRMPKNESFLRSRR